MVKILITSMKYQTFYQSILTKLNRLMKKLTMNINPIEDKFKTFGWNVITIDGHDFDQIFAALDMAKDTVKGI